MTFLSLRTGMHLLSLRTGMHDGFAFRTVGVSLLCLLLVMCGCNSCVFSIGMCDGLEWV